MVCCLALPTASQVLRGRGHGFARMRGRDQHEPHRTATPLELLFDLAFVAAFSQAGNQMAHLVADGHALAGFGGFAIAMFAICWAWINFSWFASAFDTDDWVYRLLTMTLMVGVIIVALGMPDLFHSLEDGAHLDFRIVVAGYVVMRVVMVALWIRVAIEDPVYRSTALTYAISIAVVQVGWVVWVLLDLSLMTGLAIYVVLVLLETSIPIVAETRFRTTPWNAHHIAERFGLVTIIALGEGIFGTVAAVSVLVDSQGWSKEAAFVALAGVGLTFALWWSYFVLPSGDILSKFRERGFAWGFGHIILFGAIAATGAGLHVAAYVIEGVAVIGTRGAIVAVALPVLAFAIVLFGLYTYLMSEFDRLHIALFTGAGAMLMLAIVLAEAGASIGTCLLLITAAPAIIVVGYETIGHRHMAISLDRLLRE